MRIIKENTVEYPSLYKTLLESNNKNVRKTMVNENTEAKNKHSDFFDALYIYGRKIRETNDVSAITEYLKTSLKKFIDVSEISLFNSSDTSVEPKPLIQNTSKPTLNLVHTIYEDGLLQRIFDRGVLTIIPTRSRSTSDYSYYLAIPIVDIDRSNQYLLTIKTKENNFESGTDNKKILQSFIQLFIPRIEYLLQKYDLHQTYNELQLYQSKISNDYKLSAVGEMTYSLVDQIVSPMQVILSCVEILDNDGTSDKSVINSMKSQINKVHSITNGIVKFSSAGKNDSPVTPCSINDHINEFYEFIKPSLDDNNYEVILDMEKYLPPILSSPNSLHQILTNTFSLMVDTSDTGGLYLQTKYVNQSVAVRLISTNSNAQISAGKEELNKNINLLMLETLLKKHEGTVKFTSTHNNGSSLELLFPLKRKVLK